MSIEIFKTPFDELRVTGLLAGNKDPDIIIL
jgi:hypothetical protein